MWTWPDIIASVLGLGGLIWAIVSWSIARAADTKAQSATADAADASKRAADALEVANELTKKMLDGPPPPWTLAYELPNGWQLVNQTGHMVDFVFWDSVGGEFNEPPATADQIQPGGIIALQAVKPFDYATVVVHWNSKESFTITVKRL
jgi:hypothetical protein